MKTNEIKKKLTRYTKTEKFTLEVRTGDGELAISGAHWVNGMECCFGQNVNEMKRFFPEVEPFLAFHLNHMHAGCIHQDAWPIDREVEIVTYRLTPSAMAEQRKIEEAALKRMRRGETVKLSVLESALISLAWEVSVAPDSDSVASGRYEANRREKKKLGWLRPDEHRDGLLMRPCETCGYKYGSEWLKRDLPPEVVKWFESLPAKSEEKVTL